MSKKETKIDVFASQLKFSKLNYALNNTTIELLIDIKSKLYDIDREVISKEVNDNFKKYQSEATDLFVKADNKE